MSVERLELISREAFPNPSSNAYERIEYRAHYAVDPEAATLETIVDLTLAPRDADGLVRFAGDLTVLTPLDADRPGTAILEVPNRGHRIAPSMFNRAMRAIDDREIDPGDGFLFERGLTVVFCGWQWDVPHGDGRMGLDAPRVSNPDGGRMQHRFQPGANTKRVELTDQHVGSIGNHRPITPSDEPAELMARQSIYGDATPIPTEQWRFVDDKSAIELDGGFEAGTIYDLLYRPLECPVVGAGLIAIRDMAVFLKTNANPFAPIDHVIGEGVSQCGRFLRTFLYTGLNIDEHGSKAFDGLIIHVAGGRRGEFNHRYAQPSVQPTPSFGHLHPYADAPSNGPNGFSGLLDRQRARGGMPKIFYTDTSAEYWRGDAGLTHAIPNTREDLEFAENARRYLFASTQHGAGVVEQDPASPFGLSANRFNAIDYRPLIRAALANLIEWVVDGNEPPPSAYPRWSDGTAAWREDVLDTLTTSGLVRPDVEGLNRLRPLDLGPAADRGIAALPARPLGDVLNAPVSAVDENGNETAGIAMPDVSIPVGVHTGFNPRHPATGGEGQLLEYVGSTRFFEPADLEARYGTREAYLEAIRHRGAYLADTRYLLADDVELCVQIAAERFDAAMNPAD